MKRATKKISTNGRITKNIMKGKFRRDKMESPLTINTWELPVYEEVF